MAISSTLTAIKYDFKRGQQQPVPIVTLLVIAWCAIVFLGLNMSKNIGAASAMKFGMFEETAIFAGRWYALITSAFVHKEIMHIFFNMYWLWFLGPVLERLMGSLKFLAFILVTAFISSGWQLATGHDGIGFSGVGYAIVGFGWLARDRHPEIKPYFNDRNLQLMAGWAVICFFLNYFKIQNIANMAHVMGAASGALIALAFDRKMWVARIGLVLVTCAAIVPVYWNPRSPGWNFSKALVAQENKRYDDAIRLYRRSIDFEPELWESWYNLALVYAIKGDTEKCIEAIGEVRKLKPGQADRLQKSLIGTSSPGEKSSPPE